MKKAEIYAIVKLPPADAVGCLVHLSAADLLQLAAFCEGQLIAHEKRIREIGAVRAYAMAEARAPRESEPES